MQKFFILKRRFIKADRKKYISSRFFYTHELPRIVISTCKRYVQVILLLIYSPNLYQLQLSRRWCSRLESEDPSLLMFSWGGVNTRCTLFSSQGFVPLDFPCKVFNEASIMRIIRYVYSFSFTRFFFYLVLSSKVLTRHIIYRHSRGSVINNLYYSECLIMWSSCRIWLGILLGDQVRFFLWIKGFPSL